MNAQRIARRLLEDPENDPLGIGPLGDYVGPVAFTNNTKDILDTAQFFKTQAEQAGALSAKVLGDYSEKEIDCVMLRLAVEDMAESTPGHHILYNRLKREMHSIWD